MLAVDESVGKAMVADMVFNSLAEDVEDVAPVNSRVVSNSVFPIMAGFPFQTQVFFGVFDIIICYSFLKMALTVFVVACLSLEVVERRPV